MTDEEEPPVLDRAAVAALLGYSVKSVSQFLTESRPGGRYEGNPFPAPDGRIGRGPWWDRRRKPELLAWKAARPGQGVGGGRPAHKTVRAEN